MDMKIYVIDEVEKIRENAEGNRSEKAVCVWLVQNSWSDALRFQTQYTVYIAADGEEPVHIGVVKIGQRGLGQKNENGKICGTPSEINWYGKRTVYSPELEKYPKCYCPRLPRDPGFFSLGQDTAYYWNLARFAKKHYTTFSARDYLRDMYDLAYNYARAPENKRLYAQYAKEDCLRRSLMRDITDSAFTNGLAHAAGEAVASLAMSNLRKADASASPSKSDASTPSGVSNGDGRSTSGSTDKTCHTSNAVLAVGAQDEGSSDANAGTVTDATVETTGEAPSSTLGESIGFKPARFTFCPTLGGKKLCDQKLDFNVTPDSPLKGNVMAVIGPNCVGKTRYVASIVNAFLDFTEDGQEGGVTEAERDEGRPQQTSPDDRPSGLFLPLRNGGEEAGGDVTQDELRSLDRSEFGRMVSNVICVGFSAFDRLPSRLDLTDAQRKAYHFVGLEQPPNIATLLAEVSKLLKSSVGDNADRTAGELLAKIVDCLSGDFESEERRFIGELLNDCESKVEEQGYAGAWEGMVESLTSRGVDDDTRSAKLSDVSSDGGADGGRSLTLLNEVVSALNKSTASDKNKARALMGVVKMLHAEVGSGERVDNLVLLGTRYEYLMLRLADHSDGIQKLGEVLDILGEEESFEHSPFMQGLVAWCDGRSRALNLKQGKGGSVPPLSEDISVQKFRMLSSGHKLILLTILELITVVGDGTFIIIDEPETHLHPTLLSVFIRVLHYLLDRRNNDSDASDGNDDKRDGGSLGRGFALLMTHSPVVLQDIPRSCAWAMTRVDHDGEAEDASRSVDGETTIDQSEVVVRRLEIETFGTDYASIMRQVFQVNSSNSYFRDVVERTVEGEWESGTYGHNVTADIVIKERLGGSVGNEATVAIVQQLAKLRAQGGRHA